MKRANLLIISIIIFLLFTLLFISSDTEQPVVQEEEKKVVLVLDYGEEEHSFEVPSDERVRAWNLLQQAVVIMNVDLEPTKDFRPKKIAGLVNGANNRYWNFYINGIKQETSPYDTFVEAPIEVAFRFE